MDIEAKDLIDRISSISDSIKTEMKPLIRLLADNLAKNIMRSDIVNLAKIEGIGQPTQQDIARILNRLRITHGWAIGKTSLYSYVQTKYKKAEVEAEYVQPVRVNDNYIAEHHEELEEKIKAYKRENTPAKDIITKARVDTMEKYSWKCHVAEELAMIAIKMENEHDKHDDTLCKDYAKRAKMVRDSRFATDVNSYEAIILACNSTQSLKNAISGEWQFKTFWEVNDDMDKCRECIQENCRSEKCTHECHRVIIPMTTKGLKYAIKTNEDLHHLDLQIKRLAEINNDICKIGKILLENPKTQKLLGSSAIKRLIYSHIEKDECLQCDLFLEKTPGFFDNVHV